MEIYIEYAFIENFALDFLLCYFAFKLLRLPVKIPWISFSAIVGAVFAVAYPFFNLFQTTKTLGEVGKLAFPFLACFLGFGCKIRKKDRGRYATSVIAYYCLSFLFAGGVYAFCNIFGVNYAFSDGILVGAPIATVLGVCFITAFGLKKLIKAVYNRRRLARFIYPCKLRKGDRQVCSEGYVDSGNLAQKHGIPVCFLSAELFFELFGVNAFEDGEEELFISTISGEKKIKLFLLDELWIYFGQGENIVYKPYCAVSPALQGKDYKVLLGTWATDGLKE